MKSHIIIGLYISLDFRQSWADPGSCSPSAYFMIFNRRYKCWKKCFQSSGRQIDCFESWSVLTHIVDVFPLFHVLHILQTFSMFSNPGLQDSTICRAIFLHITLMTQLELNLTILRLLVREIPILRTKRWTTEGGPHNVATYDLQALGTIGWTRAGGGQLWPSFLHQPPQVMT